MKIFSVIGLVLFQEMRPSTGSPVLDAAIHFGGLAVLCIALWIMLSRSEARYAALALDYKQEVMVAAKMRTEVKLALDGLRDELRDGRDQQQRANDELLRRITEVVTRRQP